MQVYASCAHARTARSWQRAVVAIGNFDGVHLGHRELLARAQAAARAVDGATVALTFDPHPTAVLAPAAAPTLICDIARRLELLAQAGVDAVVVQPFSAAFAAMSAQAFIEDLICRDLAAVRVVVGHDFSYGCKRTGSVATLPAHAAACGAVADVIPAVRDHGVIASSTAVRAALRAGDIASANRVLGRRYDVDGVVIHGAKRGREIGVPTANIRPTTPMLLQPGIYAVRLAVKNADNPVWLPAVASLGTNPTFVENGGLSFEVHVLDWVGDLYDQAVRVEIVARLRGEEKYAGIEPLLAQIRLDLAQARAIFTEL
ncbi:MAG: bifunctional riboflavin kinase/FAD synthetase [Kofleriaceae bacterium]|nr:bifunctional riboflavin kinase/FAD synthetase [Kofleriaceae bacterium]